MDQLRDIGERIATQDNRSTAWPLYVVFQKRRIYGMDQDYSDNVAWLDTEGDYTEASRSQHRRLEKKWDNGESIAARWQRTAYTDIDVFVTACFTEQGAEDYIRVDGHNLNKPFIYVTSLYRNHEMIGIRDVMLGLVAPAEAAQ